MGVFAEMGSNSTKFSVERIMRHEIVRSAEERMGFDAPAV